MQVGLIGNETFSEFPHSSNSTLKVSCSRWMWLWGGVHTGDLKETKKKKKRENRLSYLMSAGGQRSAAGVHMIRSQVSVERGSPPRCGRRTAPRSPRLAIRSCGSTLKARLGKKMLKVFASTFLPPPPPRGARNSSHRHPFAEHIIRQLASSSLLLLLLHLHPHLMILIYIYLYWKGVGFWCGIHGLTVVVRSRAKM